MKFSVQPDYSIRSDSGIVIRVSGMRGYEVELEGMKVAIPVDYSGGSDAYINIFTGGIQIADCRLEGPKREFVIAKAVDVLTEYLLSRSTKVCIRWSENRDEWRSPEHIPLSTRLANKIARLYTPRSKN